MPVRRHPQHEINMTLTVPTVDTIMTSIANKFPGFEKVYLRKTRDDNDKPAIEIMFRLWRTVDLRAFKSFVHTIANKRNMNAEFDYHNGAIRGLITFTIK